MDNLRTVLKKICVIREVANTLYLYSDQEKCSIAELAAALVCDLAMVPELAPVLEAAILLGWAYAESIYDIKVLLAGGKVPWSRTGTRGITVWTARCRVMRRSRRTQDQGSPMKII